MKTARGIAATAMTLPIANRSPVNFKTSHGNATNDNWSPMSEIVAPIQKRRNSRILRGSRIEGVKAAAALPATLHQLVSNETDRATVSRALARIRMNADIADIRPIPQAVVLVRLGTVP